MGVPSDGFEGTSICCAYVPKNRHAISPAILRKKVSELLPAYMLPARWKDFDRLPKNGNGNGKTDRRMLAESFQHDVIT